MVPITIIRSDFNFLKAHKTKTQREDTGFGPVCEKLFRQRLFSRQLINTMKRNKVPDRVNNDNLGQWSIKRKTYTKK